MSARFLYKVFSIKYLVLSIFILATLYILPTTVQAQQADTTSAQSTNSYQALPGYVNPQSPTYANLQIFNIMHAASCITSGVSLIGPCVDYKLNKDLQGNLKAMPVLSSIDTSGGLLGASGSVLGGLYSNPPLRTSDYLTNLGTSFGLIDEAHAQVGGSGNTVLSPIFKLWEVSRNIAYLAMILVFIAIGFMVMLRQKINPQTVVSVQLALPGLVIGLILITFSYFAASLITDFAYIGTDLVGYYFNQATGNDKGRLLDQLQDQNMLSIGSAFVGDLRNGDIATAANVIIDNLESWPEDTSDPIVNAQNIVRLTLAVIAYPIGSTVGKAVGNAGATIWPYARMSGLVTKLAPTNPTSELFAKELGGWLKTYSGAIGGAIFAAIAYTNPGFAIGWAFYLIVIFAVLYAVFRLMLALINTYLSIIFMTITAPFFFLFASLPGRQELAVNWARNMLANILTFPAVIAVLYFAAYLLGENKVAAFGVTTSLEITSRSGALPLFGGFDMSFIRVLLATGAVLATPKIPDIISRSIGKPGAAGGLFDQAINEAIGQGRQYSGQTTSGFNRIQGDVKEAWTKWRGQDPYHSVAEEVNLIRRLQGKDTLPRWFSQPITTEMMRRGEAFNRLVPKHVQTEARTRLDAHDSGDNIINDPVELRRLRNIVQEAESYTPGSREQSGLQADSRPIIIQDPTE